METSKLCPVCKNRPAIVLHHIYTCDDGCSNKDEYTPKYPSWTILICQPCNLRMHDVILFIKALLYRFKKGNKIKELLNYEPQEPTEIAKKLNRDRRTVQLDCYN